MGGFITQPSHNSTGWCEVIPLEYFPPVGVPDSSLYYFGCPGANYKSDREKCFQQETTLRKSVG